MICHIVHLTIQKADKMLYLIDWLSERIIVSCLV